MSQPVHKPREDFARSQVYILLADRIMEGLYRNRLSGKDFCTVWGDAKGNWKDSLGSFQYDVVVIDLSLFPDQEVDIIQAARAAAPNSAIIALSETNDARIAIGAFQSGVADYLLKPINPETLRWAILKVLSQRSLKPSTKELNADLNVFEAAHKINLCHAESQMRLIAAQHLCDIVGAEGALWVWQEGDSPFRFETSRGDSERSVQCFEEFRMSLTSAQPSLFHHRRTSFPDRWFLAPYLWIPLNSPWMGGLFLHGTGVFEDPEFQARVEFLIRNLETSLDSSRRLIQAKQLTYIDDLTGLYNSRYLEVALSAAMEDMKNTQNGFCVLFIDIDRFKSVNDQHGHLVGSHMLVQVAKLLRRSLRTVDRIFRYGGDEFIVLLANATIESGLETAERIRKETERRSFVYHQNKLHITLSIGVARVPDHGTEPKHVIKLADEAMYSGKKAGRNSVFVAPVGD